MRESLLRPAGRPASDMNELDALVREEIRRRGQVPFSEFMSWTLRSPRHRRATDVLDSERSDGASSAGTAAGALARRLVDVFEEMWAHFGSGRFSVVELGGAEGAAAEGILAGFKARGKEGKVSYTLIEADPAARDAARRRLSRFPKVKILERLDDLEHVSGVEGCAFSDGFFSALPFHRVVGSPEGLRELYVRETGGLLEEIAGAPSTPRLARILAEVGARLADGQKAEVRLAMDETAAELDRILLRGFVLTLDRGGPARSLYRADRGEGTLRAVDRKGRAGDFFSEIGERSFTAAVDFGRLAALGDAGDLRPLAFFSREEFLGGAAMEAAPPSSDGIAPCVLLQGKNVGDFVLPAWGTNRIHELKAASGADDPKRTAPCA